MTDLLVIHDLGAEGGAPWASAFVGWPGVVDSPDLPGHGWAPMPLGGHHEIGDAVFHLRDRLSPSPGAEPVVLGVGVNGHAARVLALGGRASALVLVDGLGGPWLDAPERNAALRDVRRKILATPESLARHEPGATDVRATIRLPPADRSFVVQMLEAMPVPLLSIETPASVTPDAEELVGVVADGTVVRVADSSPTVVARVAIDWWEQRSG